MAAVIQFSSKTILLKNKLQKMCMFIGYFFFLE